jgi:CRISPR-associated endonuclease Cas2
VCYDISDDARRSRISSLPLDFGTRIQESVFVAHLDADLAARMQERHEKLARVSGQGDDSVND